MRTAMLAALVSVLLCWPAMADFRSCVAGLKAEAGRAGIPAAIADRALGIAEPDPQVLRLAREQPEFKTPIWDYFAFLIDEQRIADGRAMMTRHDTELRAAEDRFGVDRHVIAAVWGIETDYGRETGSNFLPHALATLACNDARRASFWRGELVAALSIVARGDLALDRLYGSWAGAFGQTQFIPSTYLRLAVDFDDDGRRDLVSSVADALGSTANYLKEAGWKKDQSWMIEVKVPAGYRGTSGRKRRASLATWAGRGVVRGDGTPIGGGAEAGLILPAGPEGPGFLVFGNFDAIYAYNQAESYALAISHLADRLAGYPALRTPWPTHDPGLSRAERRRLQELLVAQGHDIGTVDGKIGPVTRAAIAKAEERAGMEPTGRAGRRIYEALGGG
jgi:lytic murein transglycosylase